MALVHERLRLKRIEAGLTFSQAAKRADVARSYLYQLEAAQSVPTIDILQSLAAAYDTSVSYLIGETGGEARSMRIAALNRLDIAITQLEDAIRLTRTAMQAEVQNQR